jgi:hypothetical protein
LKISPREKTDYDNVDYAMIEANLKAGMLPLAKNQRLAC